MNKLEEDKYIKAKEKVAELRKFYGNLMSYVIVISSLAALNYYNNEWDNAWFLWPAFGWGIGIVFKAIKIFSLNPLFSKNWEKRKIQEFMKEEEQKERWQ